jgi:ribosomal protein S4
MYGFLKIKKIKKIIQKSLKFKNAFNVFLYLIESRLDVFLYRLKVVNSVRSGKQLILHGKVLVNNKVIRAPDYNLKKKDILTMKKD